MPQNTSANAVQNTSANANANAVYSNIILRCANFVSDLLAESNIRVRNAATLASIDKIVTHKNPHLDEFIAVLLLRACLPLHMRTLPLYEIVFTSRDRAVVQGEGGGGDFADAAVIGIGGTFTQGLNAKILLDEHTKDGDTASENSVAALVRNYCVGKTTLLPRPLFTVLREVDYIDGFGGAYGQHLSNYVKSLHSAYEGELLKKEAVVCASVTALMIAVCENVDYQHFDFFREAAARSYDDYCNISGSARDPDFDEACTHTRDILTRRITYDIACGRTNLTCAVVGGNATGNGGNSTGNASAGTANNTAERGRVAVTSKSGRKLRQVLLVPYMIPLIEQYWGLDTAAVITAPLWQSQIIAQLDFLKVWNVITRVVAEKTGCYDDRIDGVSLYYNGDAGGTRATVVLAVAADINGRGALSAYMNLRCGGVGYTLFRHGANGSVILSKGRNCDEAQWEKLVELVVAAEGLTDETPPGCWHITRNAAGLAPFLVNGNAAHRYVPLSSLSGADIADMLKTIS